MCNRDIRDYAFQHNVRLWQIAMRLGINDGNFSRKLRVELSDETKNQIRKVVDELALEQ